MQTTLSDERKKSHVYMQKEHRMRQMAIKGEMLIYLIIIVVIIMWKKKNC